MEFRRYAAEPAWSLVGLLFGWACAILLIPEKEYYVPGALMVPGLVLALGILTGIAISGLKRPASIFRAEHVLMLGIIYWILLDTIQGSYQLTGISRNAVVIAFNGIAVFACFLWIGSVLVSRFDVSVPAQAKRDVGSAFLFGAVVVSFTLAMLRVFITCRMSPACVIEAFYAPRLSAIWWWADVGNWDTLLIHLRNLGYVTLPLTVALVHKHRRVDWQTVTAVVLSLLFLLILIRDGGRREVGVVLGASGLTWVLLRRSVRIKELLVMAVMVLGLIYVMQAMLAWRDQGFGAGLKEGADVKYEKRKGISVDTNFLHMAFIADYVPARHPHTGSTGVKYVFLYPIPRSILPSKPYGRGFNLPAYKGLRVGKNYSWTCSAIGDLYLIGGFLAIAVGGLIFGGLANMCTRLMYFSTVSSRLLFGIAAMTLFVGLRALHEIIVIGFAFFGLWGLLAARGWLLRPAVKMSHGIS